MVQYEPVAMQGCTPGNRVAVRKFLWLLAQKSIAFAHTNHIKEVAYLAGSRKYFVYQLNGGVASFAINLDESNTENVMGTTGDYTDSTSILNTLPTNITPRRAIYANAARTRNIAVTVLDEDTFSGILASDPTIDDPFQTGATLSLVRLEPETRTLVPTAIDTGLNDGDAT